MTSPIESTGSNPGNIPFSGPKHPMTDEEIDKKIDESEGGESGDDINSEKYQKKRKEPQEPGAQGPNMDKYSADEDGDTSVNAGVFK